MHSLHQSHYSNEIIEKLKNPDLTKERKHIMKMLLIAAENINSLGIYIFPNIIEQFKLNGFKKTTLYYDAILYIIDNISKQSKGNINWINRRNLRKSNTDDKNIIFCFLLFCYSQSFIKHLNDFLLDNETNKEKIRKLISSLQRIVNNIPNFHKIDLNKNESRNKQESKDKRNNDKIFDILTFTKDQNIFDIDLDSFNGNSGISKEFNYDFDMS